MTALHTHALRPLLVVLLASSAMGANAAQFSVTTSNDAVDALPGDGLCATAAAQCSLRAALQEANALTGEDRIELPAGTYVLGIAGSGEDAGASGDLDLDGGINLAGSGSATTIIDGGNLDRVFDLDFGDLPQITLSGITVQHGRLLNTHIDDSGAGLRARNTRIALNDVVIRDNAAGGFGTAGVMLQNACLSGQRVRLLDNQGIPANAPQNIAAGVYLTGSSCLILDEAEIRGNHGDECGAIYADQRTDIRLRRTLVSDNSGRQAGAMVLNIANVAVIENSTISGNHGLSAILNDGGSRLSLIHSTVTRNDGINGLQARVGGIQDVHGGFGLVFLRNSIVSGNGPGFSADDLQHAQSDGGGNVIGEASIYLSGPGDQLGVVAQLGPLQDLGGFAHAHLPGANVWDRGNAAACLLLDQVGRQRPQDADGDGNAQCDPGAIEFPGDTIFAARFEP